MSEYKITIQGLEKLKKAFKKSPKTVVTELSNAIRTSVNLIRPMMAQEAPYGTGQRTKGQSHLRSNIYSRSNGLTGEVGPNLKTNPYAIFVHSGTRPHEIRPRIKKALFWPGAKYPVKVVHHPGTTANPFVERTARRAEGPINKIFRNAINRIINSLVS